MSRRLSGEATQAEADELRQLLDQAPDKQYLFGVLHAYFADHSAKSGRSDEDADLEERFRRIVNLPNAGGETENDNGPTEVIPVRVLSIRRIWSYGAAVAVIICLIWGIHHLTAEPGLNIPVSHTISGDEILARAGARTSVLLPDGTRVWLNSNSKLKYNKEFNSQNREVGLEGEAFFDVTKNAALPFIVHAATLDIEVLGTSFTVKSYPKDSTVEATLLKGAIEVRRKGAQNTARVILKPNEKVVFDKFSGTDSSDRHSDMAGEERHRPVAGLAVDHIRTDLPDSEKVETAWMYNRLVFDGENFQELAVELDRWYDVDILVRDEQLNQYHFSGVFTTESIEEALKDLQLTADFTYQIKGKEINLYAKK